MPVDEPEGRGGRVVTTGEAEVLILLRTLADPTRLRIFGALRAKERCVRDLVESEGLAQPLVSHHLGALSRAGLVRARRAPGGFTMYALDPEGLARGRRAVLQLLDAQSLGVLALPGGNTSCCAGEC